MEKYFPQNSQNPSLCKLYMNLDSLDFLMKNPKHVD